MRIYKGNEIFEVTEMNGKFYGQHYETNADGLIVWFWGMRAWNTKEEVNAFLANKRAHGWT